MLKLIHAALFWRFIRSPADKRRSVAEAIAGHLIISDLYDKLRPKRMPLTFPAIIPPAGAARRLAGKTWSLDQCLELGGQASLVFVGQRGCKSDVAELALLIVKPEE